MLSSTARTMCAFFVDGCRPISPEAACESLIGACSECERAFSSLKALQIQQRPLTPNPLKAGTKYTPSVSTTDSAMPAESAGFVNSPKSIAHLMIEPVSLADPSTQYTVSVGSLLMPGRAVVCHATSGYMPCIEA